MLKNARKNAVNTNQKVLLILVLNDLMTQSIYVWSIVGAQVQTRTNIIGENTAFDAKSSLLET